MKRKIICLLMATIFLFVASCNFVSNTYKSLYAAGSVYNAGMKIVASLQLQGKITPEQRILINRYGLIYVYSYLAAIDAYAAYYQNPTSTSEDVVKTVFATLTANWADFQNLINSIIPGTIQGTLQLTKSNISSVKSLTGKQLDPTKLKTIDPTIIQFIISVAGIAIQYGLPELLALIQALGKPSVSLDDINALKTLIKLPDQY